MYQVYANSSKLLPLFAIFEQDSGKGICRAVFDDLDDIVEMVSFDVGLGKRYGAIVDVYVNRRWLICELVTCIELGVQ